MNHAFYRMLTRANQDQPKPQSKPCGKCAQCKCSKPCNPSAPQNNA